MPGAHQGVRQVSLLIAENCFAAVTRGLRPAACLYLNTSIYKRAGWLRRTRHRLQGFDRAQESRDEEVTEACVTNNAENVELRIEESQEDSTGASSRMENMKHGIGETREDSTEVTSRMEDGDTPVGGPPVSAEARGRSEGVLPSRKRGPEGVCPPEDPMLEHADRSEVRISVMSLILKSLDLASARGRVAELFCTAVGTGFERGLVVDQVTGWMNDDAGQQRSSESRWHEGNSLW